MSNLQLIWRIIFLSPQYDEKKTEMMQRTCHISLNNEATSANLWLDNNVLFLTVTLDLKQCKWTSCSSSDTSVLPIFSYGVRLWNEASNSVSSSLWHDLIACGCYFHAIVGLCHFFLKLLFNCKLLIYSADLFAVVRSQF